MGTFLSNILLLMYSAEHSSQNRQCFLAHFMMAGKDLKAYMHILHLILMLIAFGADDVSLIGTCRMGRLIFILIAFRFLKAIDSLSYCIPPEYSYDS
jgi:hypothetical protein